MPWDFPSFVAGIIIGVIIVAIILWLLYVTRSFVFSNIPSQKPICRLRDYIEDPGVAIAEGNAIADILFVAPDNEPGTSTLLYKRVPSVSTCTPSSLNQTKIVPYPQWCQFTATDGREYTGRNVTFGSPSYTFSDDANQAISVLAKGDGRCTPISSTGGIVTGGIPLLKW